MLKRLWKDTCGASAAEYALILAVLGTSIAVAALFLGGAITDSMKSSGDAVTAAG